MTTKKKTPAKKAKDTNTEAAPTEAKPRKERRPANVVFSERIMQGADVLHRIGEGELAAACEAKATQVLDYGPDWKLPPRTATIGSAVQFKAGKNPFGRRGAGALTVDAVETGGVVVINREGMALIADARWLEPYDAGSDADAPFDADDPSAGEVPRNGESRTGASSLAVAVSA